MNKRFDFQSLILLCRETHEIMQGRAARSVNIGLVVRNWLFGWYLVEYQQNGADRAEYGERFIDVLSEKLKKQGIKGGSSTRLRLYRSFYQQYEKIQPTLSGEFRNPLFENHLEIQPTVSVKSDGRISQTLSRISPDIWLALSAEFKLSWSHYVVLLTVDDSEERSFYEIEAAANSWSVRELERQISSSFYQRLHDSGYAVVLQLLQRRGETDEGRAD